MKALSRLLQLFLQFYHLRLVLVLGLLIVFRVLNFLPNITFLSLTEQYIPNLTTVSTSPLLYP